MQNKPRSPKDLAKTKLEKKAYSFSLIKDNVEYLKHLSDSEKIPLSEVIDEALLTYINLIKNEKTK